jgi:hypothetical protein
MSCSNTVNKWVNKCSNTGPPNLSQSPAKALFLPEGPPTFLIQLLTTIFFRDCDFFVRWMSRTNAHSNTGNWENGRGGEERTFFFSFLSLKWTWMNTGCLQTLIPSRCEYVPWVMRNQNHHRTIGLFSFV